MANPFFYRFPYGKRFVGETPSPLLFTKSFNFLISIIKEIAYVTTYSLSKQHDTYCINRA